MLRCFNKSDIVVNPWMLIVIRLGSPPVKSLLHLFFSRKSPNNLTVIDIVYYNNNGVEELEYIIQFFIRYIEDYIMRRQLFFFKEFW